MYIFCNWSVIGFSPKEDVLAPPPESDDVINDFDIEEEVIEVENRCVIKNSPEPLAYVYIAVTPHLYP